MIKGQKAGDGPIGVDVIEGKNYAWCSCGLSKNQPFCDNSRLFVISQEFSFF